CSTGRRRAGSPTTSGAGGTTRRPRSPGPATSTGWPRPSATWWPAGCRSTSPTWPPGSATATARSRPAATTRTTTAPPGPRRPARAWVRAAEDGAAGLLRSGGKPVAVTWRPGSAGTREHDDALVLSAPVAGLEEPLARLVDEAGDARILVVTGDPDTTGDGDT